MSDKGEQWGLSERGFHRPSYAHLLDALEHRAREEFGQGANLSVRSVLGMFLRIFAWMLHLLFALVEDVYNSRFVDTAVGVSLYNAGRSIGLRLLPARKAVGYLEVRGQPGTRVPEGFLAATVAGVQYVLLTAGVIEEDGRVQLPIQATQVGEQGNTPANTICQIVNPKQGVEQVINPQPVNGGRARESDDQYRDRYYKSVDFAGGVNVEGLRGEILQHVESVQSVLVYENDTDDVAANGLPPHSVEVVVYGGLDTAIAECIFRRRAAGIRTHGNVMVPVVAVNGQVFPMRFSRPDPVSVWVAISHLVTSQEFPSDGREQIAQVLVQLIGGDVQGGLAIGQSVYLNRLHCAINQVSGVVDYQLSLSGDGVTFSPQNIEVGIRQKAVIDPEKVVFQ